MDFKPFQAPETDYHGLNSGLSTEGGVTAKGLVDGLNEYLAHLFDRIKELEDRLGPSASTQKASFSQQISRKFEPAATTVRQDLNQAATMLAVAKADDAKPKKMVETASEAVKRVQDDLAASLAKARESKQTMPDPSPKTLADIISGVK